MSKKQRQVFVYNKSKETFLAFKVKVADSVVSRLVGLLGKRSLPPDSGVWIVPSNSVHTVGMMFSFDLVLIDKNFKVVGLHELLRPFTFTWPKVGAESVLELPAHSIFRSRTQIGDQLVIERYEAKKSSKSRDVELPVGLEASPGAVTQEPHSPVVPISSQSSRIKVDGRRSNLAGTKTH